MHPNRSWQFLIQALVAVLCLSSFSCLDPVIDPRYSKKSRPTTAEINIIKRFFSCLNSGDQDKLRSITTNETVFFTWIKPSDPKREFEIQSYEFVKTPLFSALPNLLPINNQLYRISRLRKQENELFAEMDLGEMNVPGKPVSNVLPAYLFVMKNDKIITVQPFPLLITGIDDHPR